MRNHHRLICWLVVIITITTIIIIIIIIIIKRNKLQGQDSKSKIPKLQQIIKNGNFDDILKAFMTPNSNNNSIGNKKINK